jgi:Planctomycete cytochrome C
MNVVTCICWLGFGASATTGAAVDFVREVRPILEEHCFDCHGEEKQKSRMRLDSALGILRGGESGEPFIVAGKSAESYLVKKVATENAMSAKLCLRYRPAAMNRR